MVALMSPIMLRKRPAISRGCLCSTDCRQTIQSTSVSERLHNVRMAATRLRTRVCLCVCVSVCVCVTLSECAGTYLQRNAHNGVWVVRKTFLHCPDTSHLMITHSEHLRTSQRAMVRRQVRCFPCLRCVRVRYVPPHSRVRYGSSAHRCEAYQLVHLDPVCKEGVVSAELLESGLLLGYLRAHTTELSARTLGRQDTVQACPAHCRALTLLSSSCTCSVPVRARFLPVRVPATEPVERSNPQKEPCR